MRSWHQGTFSELLVRDPEAILGELAAAAADRGLAPNPENLQAWRTSVTLLQELAILLASREPTALVWRYFLEFEVPRRARRIDIAILAHELIFLVECKAGAVQYGRADIWQTEQYALDMRDFHEGSKTKSIIPILAATNAMSRPLPNISNEKLVQEVVCVNAADFPETILGIWGSVHTAGALPIDPDKWEESSYKPTPSIVDAAKLLYQQHNVREIGLSGAYNLDSTVEAVLDLVRICRSAHRRGIAFITGAPGAGKTLAGLQVVHAPEFLRSGEALGVFLSGNRPLVEVISEALVNSSADATQRPRHRVRREVSTFIQHAYAFRNEYAERDTFPPEHVILFDEAQRAWDAVQVTRWTRGASTRSEPRIFLDVMNRVPEWAVVIALVGSGQEINRGESGLGEWGRALEQFHSDWIVRASPTVLPGTPAPPGGGLFDVHPALRVQIDARLNLQMNVRSPRAERLNQWVDHLLNLQTQDARAVCPDPMEYPMALTRSLDTARAWLRDRADTDQRSGLLASAEARRLRHWGLETQVLQRERSWADWFLRERGDVRGSDQLEVPATNFDCQGLEIDWAGVCWGNDFISSPTEPGWRTRQFKGSRWQQAKGDRARFILNGYRVLLTRARRGQIIWVPDPDGTDPTLVPEDFDHVAALLEAAGLTLVD